MIPDKVSNEKTIAVNVGFIGAFAITVSHGLRDNSELGGTVNLKRLFSMLFVAAALTKAQQQSGDAPAEAQSKRADDGAKHPNAVKSAEEKLSVTHHKMTLNGKVLAYTATAGRLPIKNDQGKTEADISSSLTLLMALSARSGLLPLGSMAARARQRFGCTWARVWPEAGQDATERFYAGTAV